MGACDLLATNPSLRGVLSESKTPLGLISGLFMSLHHHQDNRGLKTSFVVV